MLGFSVFMNEELGGSTLTYIEEMAAAGFKGIFTSMHIPEDDASRYRSRLQELGAAAKKNHLELMVDVSGSALEKAGFDRQHPEELLALGVTGLRMDYHITNEDIAKLSHQLKISLNASTLTQNDLEELVEYQADFANLEAWHNYYPRPETGLDRQWLLEKNQWLKEAGFTIQAFVAGDDQLRGPLFEGLPTLEEHRRVHPLAAALDLMRNVAVDLAYVGDGGLTADSQRQFADWIQLETLTLRVRPRSERYFDYVLGEHKNRQDEARDVLRSANARFKKVPQIVAEPSLPRKIGSVTVDNEGYLRYMGELQICKRELPPDERVNVVAEVIETDLPLIQQIKAGTKFTIESVESL